METFEGARDLLGDPIPENWGKRGRPPHIPTERNRNKVRLLLGLGWTKGRIAKSLRITQPTLREHYFSELAQADQARHQIDAERAMLIYEAARKGNVGAMKELGRLLEIRDLGRPQPPQKKRQTQPATLGKKEALAKAAQSAPEDSGWSEDLQPSKRLH